METPKSIETDASCMHGSVCVELKLGWNVEKEIEFCR